MSSTALRNSGISLVLAVIAAWVAICASGCESRPDAPDELATERANNPSVTALLDGRAPAGPSLLVPDPGSDGRTTVAALGGKSGDLDDAALATWLIWRAAHRTPNATKAGLLGVDLTAELGSDWRLRREYDVPLQGAANEAAESRANVYARVASRLEALVARQLESDLATPPTTAVALADLQRALVLAASAADISARGLVLELLGEVLAAQQQRCLAYRAWRLAVRVYVTHAAEQMSAQAAQATPDGQWTAALAAAQEGELAAVNQLLAQHPDVPGAAWLKRAGWCSWFMRQVRGDVGTAQDVWFSEYRIRQETGEPLGDLVDEPPVALRAAPLPFGTVVSLVAIGVLLLLVLARRLRRYSGRRSASDRTPSPPAA